MPDFDFDAYNHDEVENEQFAEETADNELGSSANGLDTEIAAEIPKVNMSSGNGSAATTPASSTEEVDKW
jgi:hypothetical protein